MNTEYLIVLAVTLFVPLLLSFSPRVRMYGSPLALVCALAVPTLLFGVWDIVAATRGHWTFNADHVLGIHFAGLPVEEWLFFPVIAFVSVFVWEAIQHLLRKKP